MIIFLMFLYNIEIYDVLIRCELVIYEKKAECNVRII